MPLNSIARPKTSATSRCSNTSIVEIPNQALASDFYLVGLRLDPRPVHVPRHQQHVGQYRQEPVPPADRRRRWSSRPCRHRRRRSARSCSSVCGDAKKELADSKFEFKEHNDYVEATCPWGNKFRLYEPDEERFGKINLGMPYVEFTVPEGTADGIARFYREILGAPPMSRRTAKARPRMSSVGRNQELIFRETDRKLPEYDGHHLQVYVEEFRRAARRSSKSAI